MKEPTLKKYFLEPAFFEKTEVALYEFIYKQNHLSDSPPNKIENPSCPCVNKGSDRSTRNCQQYNPPRVAC